MKRISFLIVISISSSLVSAQTIPTDGLIAYYPFNGDASDASGSGFHGTLNGASLTNDRFGNPDAAYYFDGVDDQITLLQEQTILGIDPVDFTICGWFNLQGSNPEDLYIFGDYGNWTDNKFGININISNIDHTVRTAVRGSMSQNYGVASTIPILPNKWNHFASIYSESLGKIQLYINGKLVGEDNFDTSIDYFTDNSELMIGRHKSGGDFVGSIDDIRIYNIGLSESEINALYQEEDWNSTNELRNEDILPFARYRIRDEFEEGLEGIIVANKLIGIFSGIKAAQLLLDDLILEFTEEFVILVGQTALVKVVETIVEEEPDQYITLCVKIPAENDGLVTTDDFIFLLENVINDSGKMPIGFPLNCTYRLKEVVTSDNNSVNYGVVETWEGANNYKPPIPLESVIQLSPVFSRRILDDISSNSISTLGIVNGYTFQLGKPFMILKEYDEFDYYIAGSDISMHFVPVDMSNQELFPSIGSLVEITANTVATYSDRAIWQDFDSYPGSWKNVYLDPINMEILNGNYYTDSPSYGTSLVQRFEGTLNTLYLDWNSISENKVDLLVSDISKSPSDFIENDGTYTITADIKNAGFLAASCKVIFYCSDDIQCFKIGETFIDDVFPDNIKKASIQWLTNDLNPQTNGSIIIIAKIVDVNPGEYKVDNNIRKELFNVWTEFVNSFMSIDLFCAVSLDVVAPNGQKINITTNQIDSAEYIIDDFDNNGTLDHRIIISDPDTGLYDIKVIPFEFTESDDTYTLKVKQDNSINILAENKLAPLSSPEIYQYHNLGFNTSINNKGLSKKLYPNPFRDFIFFDGLDKTSEYIIVNSNGQEILSGSLQPRQGNFDLSHLPSGVYLVKIIGVDGEIILSKKIIKE